MVNDITKYNDKSVNYNISLDIGTNSVGWAVTDENSKLLKIRNKNFWGVNLFDSADTAKKRRLFRAQRRRYVRRRQRIHLLQDLMCPLIEKMDKDFFKKMKYSYLDAEDRGDSQLTGIKDWNKDKTLFFGDDFFEEGFYKKYSKTIYHLRKYLMETNDKVDPRLIYLALHHIIKYRGNFLYEGIEIDLNDTKDVKFNFEDLFKQIDALNDTEIQELVDINEIILIISNKSFKKSEKKEKLEIVFKLVEKKFKTIVNALISALIGNKFNYAKLCGRDFDVKIKMSDEIEKSVSAIEDKGLNIEILENLNSIYNFTFISNFLDVSKRETYSDAMIGIYEKHKKDLTILKRYLKKYTSKEVYDKIFKSKDKNTKKQTNLYFLYTKKLSKVNKFESRQKDFGENIKFIIEDLKDNEDKKYILSEIDESTFMPLLNSTLNAAIPYQFNLHELIKIIDNQSIHYPYLKEIKEKITSILTFKIPYYVGPLVNIDDEKTPFSWVKRNNDGKIYPWNWEVVIDKEETAERFIKRMTNHCTYLLSEDVLPKNSLLYSKYELLNELNKVKINNHLIEKNAKEKIIKDLFMKKTKISINEFATFIIDNAIFFQDSRSPKILDNVLITGTQKKDEFASSLKPWIDFKNIYGEQFDEKKDEIEQIIEWLTVYNDKDIIKNRIKKTFPNISLKKLNKILKLKYKGYGRLSRKLLEEIQGQNDKKDPRNIIEMLEETNFNFMQIINNKEYKFSEKIKEENEDVGQNKSTEQLIDLLVCSPAIKRSIKQATKIVEEIENYLGEEPNNIFIEMAREEQKKGVRTESRLERYTRIYNGLVKEKIILDGKLITEKDEIYSELENLNLNDEKIFLYVMQHGKCMYTLKKIGDLSKCEVDHIIPQSYLKDDGISNKVLVYREENQRKKDDLLLNENIIDKCESYWRKLRDIGLISNKKYFNLTRKTITDNDKVAFINRQLVETRQISKKVAEILKDKYPSTNVVSVKAGLVSEFRKKNSLYKLRNLNDVHHVHDAYLAGMIGNYILKKYPFMKSGIVFDGYSKYHFGKYKDIVTDMQNRYKEKTNVFGSFVVHQLGENIVADSNGEVIWEGQNSIEYVKKILNYKDYFITYKKYYGQSELFNQTLYSPEELEKSKKNVYSIKSDRPFYKYGGYTSENPAYGIAIKYKKGKKFKNEVISIPMSLYYANENELKEYLANLTKCKIEEIEILKEKIMLGQMFVTGNSLLTMSSPSEWTHRRQLFVNKKYHETLFYIEKNDIGMIDEDVLEHLAINILETTKNNVPILYSQCDKVSKAMLDFNKLSKEEKMKVVSSIVTGFNSSKTSPEIKFGKVKVIDRLGRLSSRKFDLDNTLFIDQSITGVYKKAYKLK